MWIFCSDDLICFLNVPFFLIFELGTEIVNTAFLCGNTKTKAQAKSKQKSKTVWFLHQLHPSFVSMIPVWSFHARKRMLIRDRCISRWWKLQPLTEDNGCVPWCSVVRWHPFPSSFPDMMNWKEVTLLEAYTIRRMSGVPPVSIPGLW